jgi:hypothetical protein
MLAGNLLFLGVLPFYEPVNIAITIFNGGFILSHLSHEFKNFLLLVNNQQFDQLSDYKAPQIYLKESK